MQYISIIQDSIDYIELNLKAELYAQELADRAGFSLFHYYRIFQEVLGIAVMQYVLRRRLIHAIYDISLGGKIIDVALSYGFDTHAGFFKAFKREYGEAPSAFLKRHRGVKPYKINLFQEDHIMITQKKVKELLIQYWGIQDAKLKNIFCDANGQLADDVWYVNEEYVIKAGTNIRGMKHHIEISIALKEAGLQAAVPVPTKEGRDYIIEGDIYYLLMDSLNGDAMKSADCYEGDYKTKARYLGEIIGQLHKVLLKYDREIICNEPNLLEDVIRWAMPQTKQSLQLPESFYRDYLTIFGSLFSKLPRQIIHRDPNPGNIIISEGKLTGFIDFELSERNIRLFDPCYAATAILSDCFPEITEVNRLKWFDIFHNIIHGYDSVNKLTEDEKKALPYVVFSIQMIFVAYCNRIDNLTQLGITNRKMLSWLIDNKESLEYRS